MGVVISHDLMELGRIPLKRYVSTGVSVGEESVAIGSVVLGHPYRNLAVHLVNNEEVEGPLLEDVAVEFQLVSDGAWLTRYSAGLGSLTEDKVVSGLSEVAAAGSGHGWFGLPPCYAVRVICHATTGGAPANSVDADLTMVFWD